MEKENSGSIDSPFLFLSFRSIAKSIYSPVVQPFIRFPFNNCLRAGNANRMTSSEYYPRAVPPRSLEKKLPLGLHFSPKLRLSSRPPPDIESRARNDLLNIHRSRWDGQPVGITRSSSVGPVSMSHHFDDISQLDRYSTPLQGQYCCTP